MIAQGTDIGVTLSWNANPASEGVTQYQVWYSETENGKYKLLGTTESTAFEYIAPMSAGWYRVSAVSPTGESKPTSSVEVKSGT
jgi:penicillin-binding protein